MLALWARLIYRRAVACGPGIFLSAVLDAIKLPGGLAKRSRGFTRVGPRHDLEVGQVLVAALKAAAIARDGIGLGEDQQGPALGAERGPRREIGEERDGLSHTRLVREDSTPIDVLDTQDFVDRAEQYTKVLR